MTSVATKRIRVRKTGLLLTGILCVLAGASVAQQLEPPVLLGTPSTLPAPVPSGTAPLSWTDARFANVQSSSPLNAVPSGGSVTDKSITETGSLASIRCENSCTLTRVRVNSREALRVVRGNVVVRDSWLEAKGISPDHADVIQTYSPGATGTITLQNTTIRAYTGAATAGVFVADDWNADLVSLENVVIWGGPWGLRLHTDGYTNAHLRMRNVCFITGSFGSGRFIIDDGKQGGGGWKIDEWTNVNDCTIVNGQLVRGTAIARPN